MEIPLAAPGLGARCGFGGMVGVSVTQSYCMFAIPLQQKRFRVTKGL
jgi:hypothetical protein